MAENQVFLAFTHVADFLRHRGLKTGFDFGLGRAEFIRRLSDFGYIRVDAQLVADDIAAGSSAGPGAPEGRRGRRGDTVIVIILNPAHDYSRHAAPLRKLLATATVSRPAKEGKLHEVVIFGDKDAVDRKSLQGILNEFNVDGGRGPSAARYSLHPFRILAVVVPEAVVVPPHTILSPDEARGVLDAGHLEPRDLPQIYDSDPVAVWLGARAGQVLKIERASETGGVALAYRLVTRS